MAREGDDQRGILRKARSSLRTPLVRNAAFMLATAILTSGLGFLFWLVVARSYPPGAVGFAASLLSAILLLAMCATIGLPSGIIRFLPEERDKATLLNGAFTTAGIVAIVLGVAFLAGLDIWAPSFTTRRADLLFLTFFFLSILFFAFDGILDNAFVAARRAHYETMRVSIYHALRVPTVLGVSAAFGGLGIMFSWTVPLVLSVAVGLLFLPRVFPGYRPAISLRRVRGSGILGYSAWMYGVAVVSGIGLLLLPLVILNTFGEVQGAPQSAYFYAAFSLAVLLYSIPESFTKSLFVEGSHPNARYARDVRRTLRLSVPLLALGILGSIVLGRPVLALFGEDYAANSYPSLIILAFGGPVVLARGMLSTTLQVTRKVRSLFVISVLSTGATLGLTVALLPSMGIEGVAIALVAGEGLGLPFLFLAVRGNRGASPPPESVSFQR